MSDLSLFLKKNKTEKEHVFYPATKSLRDAEGKPLLWELRPLTTKESEALRTKHTKVSVAPGKSGKVNQSVDDRFVPALVCAAVVHPDLNDAELQDSYGVMSPEDLILEMIDSPGEWDALAAKVMKLSGMGESLDDEVEEAKN